MIYAGFGSQGCCCTDGGCREFENNCQSDKWYFNASANSTIACAPTGCDHPCKIDPSEVPLRYVNELIVQTFM